MIYVIQLSNEMIAEAMDYAIKSKEYLSKRHGFHEGGLEANQRKMFEGKLGEKIVKYWFIEQGIQFEEDESHYTVADKFDFKVNGKRIDVKTRTKDYLSKLLEIKETFDKDAKDIYIAVRLIERNNTHGYIIGWCTKEDIKEVNRVGNMGYLDNYEMFDEELREPNYLKEYLLLDNSQQ